MADLALNWDSLFKSLKSQQYPNFVADSASFDKALLAMAQNGVRLVMLQNAKGTGDIFQVGAALCCEADLGVIVLSCENDTTGRDKPGMIVPHYLSDWQIHPARVVALKTPDPEKAIKALLPAQSLKGPGCEFALSTVGHASNILQEKLHASEGNAAERLLGFRKLLLSGANIGDEQIYQFLELKNVRVNRDIVVLWSRGSGKKGGLHDNLDSSATAMSQLCSRLIKERTVIVAGDLDPRKMAEHAGFEGAIFFGEFWNDYPFKGKTRACQLKLFDLILSKSRSLVHVGMRSGTLDSYALLMHRVIYIVDRAEVGLGLDARMTKLIGGNTPMTYERFTAARAPKLFGQFSTYAEKDKRYYPIAGKTEVLGYPLKNALIKLQQTLKGAHKEMVDKFNLLLAAGNGRDQYRYFKRKFVVEMSALYSEPYVKLEESKKVAIDDKVLAIMELYETLLEHVLKVVRDRRGFGQEDLDELVLKILKWV